MGGSLLPGGRSCCLHRASRMNAVTTSQSLCPSSSAGAPSSASLWGLGEPRRGVRACRPSGGTSRRAASAPSELPSSSTSPTSRTTSCRHHRVSVGQPTCQLAHDHSCRLQGAWLMPYLRPACACRHDAAGAGRGENCRDHRVPVLRAPGTRGDQDRCLVLEPA